MVVAYLAEESQRFKFIFAHSNDGFPIDVFERGDGRAVGGRQPNRNIIPSDDVTTSY